MLYKYREFTRNTKEPFDKAEAGEVIRVERKGIVFVLVAQTKFEQKQPEVKEREPYPGQPQPVVMSAQTMEEIKNDLHLKPPPRYPSGTVATGLNSKQRKLLVLAEQKKQREQRRMDHLNDAGIRYDAIPE